MIEKLIEQLLKEVGEDPKREGLLKTPERVAASIKYLTSGYDKKVEDVLNEALFVEDYDEMVIVKDIDWFSLCEHHGIPFFGKAHIAYMPRKKIVGLSKIPRLVDMFSKRLQVQERLTTQIANALNDALQPRGGRRAGARGSDRRHERRRGGGAGGADAGGPRTGGRAGHVGRDGGVRGAGRQQARRLGHDAVGQSPRGDGLLPRGAAADDTPRL